MASFDQLSSRERRLVTFLGIAFAVVAAVLVPLRVSAYLSKRQSDNDDVRRLIADIGAARARIAAKRAVLGDVAARYADRAPALGTLVDTAAKSAGLDVASQQDLPPIPRGKLYTERASKLSIQKTKLKPLVTFMEAIETSGHPVAITQFDVSKRIEPDSYTANMTIAAYDRAEPPPAPAPGSSR